VQFISNQTGFPVVTAHITAIAAPASDGSQILTFDQTIPALATADLMVYADATLRGSGLLLQNNVIEELLFARGISVWGSSAERLAATSSAKFRTAALFRTRKPLSTTG